MNQSSFRDRQRTNYVRMRMVYDIAMGLMITSMGIAMFAAEWLHIEQIVQLDALMRYLFGGLCFLYGGFRLYRAIKQVY